jgi:hypothetical protein
METSPQVFCKECKSPAAWRMHAPPINPDYKLPRQEFACAEHWDKVRTELELDIQNVGVVLGTRLHGDVTSISLREVA